MLGLENHSARLPVCFVFFGQYLNLQMIFSPLLPKCCDSRSVLRGLPLPERPKEFRIDTSRRRGTNGQSAGGEAALDIVSHQGNTSEKAERRHHTPTGMADPLSGNRDVELEVSLWQEAERADIWKNGLGVL